ncbi:glycosyltransferase [Lentzea sp. E54]|uniref:glycosyltransferase n=1 Tax=Lentzea xerophila TaxID=3435883 RepID=UPI003DA4A60B
MKIAMVSAEDTPEWRDVHVTDLSKALTALGHEVTAHRLDGAQADQELHLGDFVEVLRADWNRSRPDLVHAHSWRPGLAASLAARTSGLPVVQSFHGFGRRADVERLVSREAALVLASCEHEMFDLAAAGIPRARIAVVARGVDTDLFQSHGEVAARGPMRRIVTMVDPLSDNGAADLVAALPRLPDVELVIAGAHAAGGADRVLSRVRQLGVEKRTLLLGPVARRDMPALLRSADVVAYVPRLPSWDPLPLEAMACGVPVVATAVGGLTDAVIDGVTGVLVPPREPKQLVRTLWAVLADDTLRDSCGIAAVDRVDARHTWPSVAVTVDRLYRRLVQSAVTSPAVGVNGG